MAPTLTTHVNHLPSTQYTRMYARTHARVHTHTHTHTHNVLLYIVQQTTHLHEARVKVKMAHASVVVTLIPLPWGGSLVKTIIYQRILLVVTFLARSCFPANGMHIPCETGVLILTLYLLNSALYFFANFLKELHNLLYQNPWLINLSVSNLCLFTKASTFSQILFIQKICEMYTPYVGLAGILLHMKG